MLLPASGRDAPGLPAVLLPASGRDAPSPPAMPVPASARGVLGLPAMPVPGCGAAPPKQMPMKHTPVQFSHVPSAGG